MLNNQYQSSSHILLEHIFCGVCYWAGLHIGRFGLLNTNLLYPGDQVGVLTPSLHSGTGINHGQTPGCTGSLHGAQGAYKLYFCLVFPSHSVMDIGLKTQYSMRPLIYSNIREPI